MGYIVFKCLSISCIPFNKSICTITSRFIFTCYFFTPANINTSIFADKIFPLATDAAIIISSNVTIEPLAKLQNSKYPI